MNSSSAQTRDVLRSQPVQSFHCVVCVFLPSNILSTDKDFEYNSCLALKQVAPFLAILGALTVSIGAQAYFVLIVIYQYLNRLNGRQLNVVICGDRVFFGGGDLCSISSQRPPLFAVAAQEEDYSPILYLVHFCVRCRKITMVLMQTQ